MKRLILLALAVIIAGNVSGQSLDDASAPILLNYSTLKRKAEKSDEDIVHDRKKTKDRTWIKRGELFQDIDNQGLEQAQVGLTKTVVSQIYGEPKSVETQDDGTEVHIYENIKYYYENNVLRGWERIDPIHEAPLDEAFRSYKKAIELNESEEDKMTVQEKIDKELSELKEQYLREGLNEYYLENYEGALEAFESILAVNKLPIFKGAIDTVMINYAGITARDLGAIYSRAEEKEKAKEKYNKSIKYYKQLADLGFGGATTYRQMTADYYMIGDTLGAIKNLKEGIDRYPDSTVLVSLAAQAYYQLRDNEKGLEFVNEILDENPKNAIAYYWKGLFITNEENVEEDVIQDALALYDTALMYDPSDANIWYQSGYVNYAVGANYFEQEGYEEDSEFRAELNAKGVEYYETAVEKLEKTYEIAAEGNILRREALDLLKRIYYKLYGNEDERYQSVIDRANNL